MLDEKSISLTEMVFNHANQNQVPDYDSGLRVCNNQVVCWRSYRKNDGSYNLVYVNFMNLKSHVLMTGSNKQDVERYLDHVQKRYPLYDSRNLHKRMTKLSGLDRLTRQIA